MNYSKNKKLLLCFFFSLCLLALNAECEPTIRQIFPRQNLFLGETVDWVIEVRYPLWESYELSLKSPEGAEMRIVEKSQESIANEMRSVYRIRVEPQSLVVNGTPSVLITDGRGTNSVLNGKPLTVRMISGDSLQIKDPVVPRFRALQNPVHILLATAGVLILLSLLIFLRIRRKHASSPRQTLLRQLRRSHQELQRSGVRNPLVLSKLLRSELIWEFPAESFTASELKEKADERKLRLAEALEILDLTRYSPEPDPIEAKKVEEALGTAIQILKTKHTDQNFSGDKAA